MDCRGRRGPSIGRIGSQADPPIIGLALFHAQQAAEKSIKGFLVFNGRRFALTHNLAELARPAVEIDPDLRSIISPGLGLTTFSTLYRYPGEPEMPSLDSAFQWLKIAEKICRSITTMVEQPNQQGGKS